MKMVYNSVVKSRDIMRTTNIDRLRCLVDIDRLQNVVPSGDWSINVALCSFYLICHTFNVKMSRRMTKIGRISQEWRFPAHSTISVCPAMGKIKWAKSEQIYWGGSSPWALYEAQLAPQMWRNREGIPGPERYLPFDPKATDYPTTNRESNRPQRGNPRDRWGFIEHSRTNTTAAVMAVMWWWRWRCGPPPPLSVPLTIHHRRHHRHVSYVPSCNPTACRRPHRQ